MKKLAVVLSIVAFSSTNLMASSTVALTPVEQAFKSGFEYGLKTALMQQEVDNVKPVAIDYTKPYVVMYKISKLAYSEVLLMQMLAYNEGFHTHLGKDWLFFGDFEREADAKAAATYIQKNFYIKPDIKKLSSVKKELFTYPLLWSDVYSKLFAEAKEKGLVEEIVVEVPTTKVVEKIVEVPAKPSYKKPASSKPKTVKAKIYDIKLINKQAMSYKLVGDKSSSSSYVENGIKSGQFVLEPKGIYTTKEGERFYRTTENFYFLDKDAKLYQRK